MRWPRTPERAPTKAPMDRLPGLFGYAWVSIGDQNTALQLDAPRTAGCDEVFEDCISGKTTSRPAFHRLLPQMRRSDALAIWKFNRLGRGVLHLVALMEELRTRGIEFRSITESMDTRTVMGRAMFQLVAVFAELERGQNHERIAAAKVAGVHCGRLQSLSPAHVDDARTKIRDEEWSWARAAAFQKVSRTTLYDAIRRADLARATTASGLVPIKRGLVAPGF